MKFVITLTAIFCFIIASCYGQSQNIFWGTTPGWNDTQKSHSVFWGTPAWNDTRILYQQVNVSSSFLQVTERDVVFPSPGFANYRPITAIRAFDQKTNGNGAYATIKSGGIYAYSVIVHLTSQRGHGINFIVEIYVK